MQITMFGQLIVDSPLSFRKNSIKYTNKIKMNIVDTDNPLYIEHGYRALPVRFKG